MTLTFAIYYNRVCVPLGYKCGPCVVSKPSEHSQYAAIWPILLCQRACHMLIISRWRAL